jgi:hypothetical protein
MFLGCKVRRVRRADNLAAICEPFVLVMWDFNRPPRPVTGIDLFFYYFTIDENL